MFLQRRTCGVFYRFIELILQAGAGSELFSQALSRIVLETDLTGAARAIFGDKEGITAILGTGANAGYYNGYSIIHQPKSLGFFLGDEGSGAYLGKQLLKAYLEETLPEAIAGHLSNTFKGYPDDWIQNLLKQPAAYDYGRFAAEMLALQNASLCY
ncbi:MAG: hypothetical protein U5L09_05450 [Bacteroidales bacterium]|nr:hypothetical protein [Bacteroidales bacterium]